MNAAKQLHIVKVEPLTILVSKHISLYETRRSTTKTEPNDGSHRPYGNTITASGTFSSDSVKPISQAEMWKLHFAVENLASVSEGFKVGKEKYAVPSTFKVSECEVCVGAGFKPCRDCHNTGRTKCHSCDGLGRRSIKHRRGEYSSDEEEVILPARVKKEVTYTVSSRGATIIEKEEKTKIRASKSPKGFSRGTAECPKCLGSGKRSCSSCNGTGKCPCSKCNGKGSVVHFQQIKFERQTLTRSHIFVHSYDPTSNAFEIIENGLLSNSLPVNKSDLLLATRWTSRTVSETDIADPPQSIPSPDIESTANLTEGATITAPGLIQSLDEFGRVSFGRNAVQEEEGLEESTSKWIAMKTAVEQGTVYKVTCKYKDKIFTVYLGEKLHSVVAGGAGSGALVLTPEDVKVLHVDGFPAKSWEYLAGAAAIAVAAVAGIAALLFNMR
jgi:hypothetical protein